MQQPCLFVFIHVFDSFIHKTDEEIKNLDNFDEEDLIQKTLLTIRKTTSKLIYQQDCCVMHVKSSVNSLGNIDKVNFAIFEVFE